MKITKKKFKKLYDDKLVYILGAILFIGLVSVEVYSGLHGSSGNDNLGITASATKNNSISSHNTKPTTHANNSQTTSSKTAQATPQASSTSNTSTSTQANCSATDWDAENNMTNDYNVAMGFYNQGLDYENGGGSSTSSLITTYNNDINQDNNEIQQTYLTYSESLPSGCPLDVSIHALAPNIPTN